MDNPYSILHDFDRWFRYAKAAAFYAGGTIWDGDKGWRLEVKWKLLNPHSILRDFDGWFEFELQRATGGLPWRVVRTALVTEAP